MFIPTDFVATYLVGIACGMVIAGRVRKRRRPAPPTRTFAQGKAVRIIQGGRSDG